MSKIDFDGNNLLVPAFELKRLVQSHLECDKAHIPKRKRFLSELEMVSKIYKVQYYFKLKYYQYVEIALLS